MQYTAAKLVEMVKDLTFIKYAYEVEIAELKQQVLDHASEILRLKEFEPQKGETLNGLCVE